MAKEKTKKLKFEYNSAMSEEFVWAQTYAAWRANVPAFLQNTCNLDEAAATVADRAVLQFRKRLV